MEGTEGEEKFLHPGNPSLVGRSGRTKNKGASEAQRRAKKWFVAGRTERYLYKLSVSPLSMPQPETHFCWYEQRLELRSLEDRPKGRRLLLAAQREPEAAGVCYRYHQGCLCKNPGPTRKVKDHC